jgi:hypothetical protein
VIDLVSVLQESLQHAGKSSGKTTKVKSKKARTPKKAAHKKTAHKKAA